MRNGVGGLESRRPSHCVERLRVAADERDWELLRSLCHPDALLVLRMTEGRALSVDEAIAVLHEDAEAGAYEPTHYYIGDLDGQAAVAVGTVMGPNDQKPKHLCWLLTFVDGLLYRQALCGTADEAEQLYRERGLELGLSHAKARRAIEPVGQDG
jgi:hypothetical protein